jgi:TonB-linked SusC/RagA family outer membrane protein
MMNIQIKIILAILSLSLLFQAYSIAQNQDTRTIIVKDESSNPVPGATIIIGEDGKPFKTNERGEFDIDVVLRVGVLISAEGFESQIVYYAPKGTLSEVILKQMPYHMSESDIVDVPFGNIKQRQITGAVTRLQPSEILLYDYQSNVNGILQGRIPGLFGASNIRGMGDPLYVVDGIARPITGMLNVHDIKQISVLKDMSTSMLYGPQAINGVIFITTKRGEPFKRRLMFTTQSGMDVPISYPNYLPAADYMELFNEALDNDGLSPRYTLNQIANTRSGMDPIRYPDEHYYNSTYLNDWSTYRRINAEISGGNEIAQFFLNLGWDHSTGLLKVGEGANEKSDRLNMRGNIDYDITDKIGLNFDGAVIMDISKLPRYSSITNDFWSLSSTLRPDLYPVLIPIDLIEDTSLKDATRPVYGNYVFGGTSEFLTNIYGELSNNGNRSYIDRLVGINSGLNFDLSSITDGLKFSVLFSFDMFNQYREELNNTYAVYSPVYFDDAITSWNKYNTDTRLHARSVGDAYYYRRFGTYGTLDYFKRIDDHEITATGLMYASEFSREGIQQNEKNLHAGLRINYMFKNKYMAQLTGVHAGSLKLYHGNNRWAFSPGIGLGWILTEEDFLQDNSLVNYLKLRGTWAINQTDQNLGYNLGTDYYQSGSTFLWGGGSYSNSARTLFYGNPNLQWEKIMNLSLGFESMLLDYQLGIEASYFYNKHYDVVTQRTNTIGSFFPGLHYENYESYQTQGVELGLHYTARLGDMTAIFGGNYAYSVPKVLVIDELPYTGDLEHLRRTGRATDAIYGLVALGLFKDQPEIDNSPYQYFGPVQPGDIKYKDINGDGVIDENDLVNIGNSQARMEFGLNLRLQYKSFELFTLGRGQSGQNRYFNNQYYWVYGDRKYSEIVWDRWTPETAATASYPRLSSTSNANNFRNSTFWLSNTNWFTIRTMQLTYKLSGREFAGLDEVRFFLRAHNLVMISKERDKLQLNVGSLPQMRSFSVGLNFNFI